METDSSVQHTSNIISEKKSKKKNNYCLTWR